MKVKLFSFLLVAISVISCTDNIPQPNEEFPETILRNFEAHSVPNAVNLAWFTQKEVKTISFEIQTSKNAENWITVTKVKAWNQSNVSYTYTHEKVNPSLVQLYRLKVENEKEIFYSDTIGVTINGIYL